MLLNFTSLVADVVIGSKRQFFGGDCCLQALCMFRWLGFYHFPLSLFGHSNEGNQQRELSISWFSCCI